MKKQDLETGMVLVTRKGTIAMFVDTATQKLILTIGSEVSGRFQISDLDDDLKSASNKEFDIIRVYRFPDLGGIALVALAGRLSPQNLLWERKEFKGKLLTKNNFTQNLTIEELSSMTGLSNDGHKAFQKNLDVFQIEIDCEEQIGSQVSNWVRQEALKDLFKAIENKTIANSPFGNPQVSPVTFGFYARRPVSISYSFDPTKYADMLEEDISEDEKWDYRLTILTNNPNIDAIL